MSPSRGVVIASLAVALLLGGCADGADPPAGAPTASPSTSDGAPPADDARGGQRVTCPPRDDATGSAGATARQVTRVAQCAVIAYTEFSWRDEDHRAFLDRVAPYATDAFAAELRELFGEAVPAEAAAWEELAAARTAQRTIVVGSEAARGDDEGWTVEVEVEAERRTEAAAWGPHGEPRTYRVTVVPNGSRLLVADIA